MDRLILRLAFNALAVYLAVGPGWISGIEVQTDTWWAYVLLGLVFAIVNALVRPILKILTCPLILLTLGLFTLVINAIIFGLTGWIGQQFGFGFSIAGGFPKGLIAAILGGLIVGIVNAVLNFVFKEEKQQKERRM